MGYSEVQNNLSHFNLNMSTHQNNQNNPTSINYSHDFAKKEK